MRRVGGPLLCIDDLLSDVGEQQDEDSSTPAQHLLELEPEPEPQLNSDIAAPDPSQLPEFFQEHYDKLNEALSSSDPSWTALTLKLCAAVETAKKLIQSTNANAISLSDKVEQLEAITKRGDSAVAAARAISTTLSQKKRPSSLN